MKNCITTGRQQNLLRIVDDHREVLLVNRLDSRVHSREKNQAQVNEARHFIQGISKDIPLVPTESLELKRNCCEVMKSLKRWTEYKGQNLLGDEAVSTKNMMRLKC